MSPHTHTLLQTGKLRPTKGAIRSEAQKKAKTKRNTLHRADITQALGKRERRNWGVGRNYRGRREELGWQREKAKDSARAEVRALRGSGKHSCGDVGAASPSPAPLWPGPLFSPAEPGGARRCGCQAATQPPLAAGRPGPRAESCTRRPPAPRCSPGRHSWGP